MRRIGRAAFVFFYIWGTVTVSGERSARVVDLFKHGSWSGTVRIESPSHHSGQDLPNFGHAKRAKPNVVDVAPQWVHVPQVVIRQFESRQVAEYFPVEFCFVNDSRAPPALT
jgi:hypothetical protein